MKIITFPILITGLIIGSMSFGHKVLANTTDNSVQLQDKYKNTNINIVKSDYDAAEDLDARLNILKILEDYNGDNKDILLFLGDAYSRIAGVPTDVSKAIGFYNKSVEQGNLWGLIRVGDLCNDGTLIPRDPTQAFSFYKAAADKGLSFAKLRLGNAYLSGNGVGADITQGLRLIKESAETGDQWALMRVGDLYRFGDYVAVDRPAAIGFYQKAAIAGNDDGLIKLSDIYRDGVIASKDAQKSIAYLEQASDKGIKRARVILGQNHIWKKYGALSDPAKGMRLITQAHKMGEPSAAPALANIYMNGTLVARNPQRAIRILTKAADANNAAAVTQLLSYYRDGRNGALSQDIVKAREIFQKYQGVYTPAERLRQDIILQAATARHSEDYVKIVELLKTAPASIQSETISALRNVNANAFVFVVQERLKQRGFYEGKNNGLLTTATISSINKLCQQSVAAHKCSQGPLSPAAVRLIAVLLQ